MKCPLADADVSAAILIRENWTSRAKTWSVNTGLVTRSPRFHNLGIKMQAVNLLVFLIKLTKIDFEVDLC
jgi:hypothetical protein